MRVALVALALAPAACVVAPLDPVPAAVQAAEDGDLLRALAYLDQLPPMHPRHAEAAAFARALEARIAASQRWLGESARLHVQGDTTGAAVALQHAREAWPHALFAPWPVTETVVTASMPQAAPPAPLAESAPTIEVARAEGALDSPELPGVLAQPPEWSAATRLQLVAVSPPMDPARQVTAEAELEGAAGTPITATKLASLRAVVRGRDKSLAITRLAEAHAEYPANLEVRTMLASLLRQRALVAYGRGWLEAAVEDWEQIAQLAPDDMETLGHLDVAREELRRRRGWPERRKNAGG